MASCSDMYTWVDLPTYEWIDSEIVTWGLCVDLLYQIYTDNNYVYAATSSGLNIISLQDQLKGAYVPYELGFSSVCGNNDKVYLGTFTDGIKYLYKSSISLNYDFPLDLSSSLFNFDSSYQPSYDKINHIFLLDDIISISTDVGLDVISLHGQGFKSSVSSTKIIKSFLTSKREVYYISKEDYYQVNKVNSYLFDWTVPDKIFNANDDFVKGEVDIKDIYVSCDTSSVDGFNTLFMATSSGIYVLDEGDETCDFYY
jgi:hypothetical protein